MKPQSLHGQLWRTVHITEQQLHYTNIKFGSTVWDFLHNFSSYIHIILHRLLQAIQEQVMTTIMCIAGSFHGLYSYKEKPLLCSLPLNTISPECNVHRQLQGYSCLTDSCSPDFHHTSSSPSECSWHLVPLWWQDSLQHRWKCLAGLSLGHYDWRYTVAHSSEPLLQAQHSTPTSTCSTYYRDAGKL